MRTKIDYGIDLGTTNSAICKMHNGEAVIIKNDTTQMDTTPSVVFFDKNQRMLVGVQAKNLLNKESLTNYKKNKQSQANGFQEFKRMMGTDHQFHSVNMGLDLSSEQLSAEILKTLKGFVQDEQPSCAVITVPAMFKQSQLDATQRSAMLAGFQYCELLQEPIAASIAYGIKANDENGYWLVFDFGGGTFDAALMKVEDKIMKVIDTEGDNYLGGKNIDTAIVDQLLIPQFSAPIETVLNDPKRKMMLQEALKFYAEQAKITLSSKENWSNFIDDIGEDDHGDEIEFDAQISLAMYESVVKPIFQSAIDVVKKLLERNHLKDKDLKTIILVGGPTYSQTLRQMLAEQFSANIDYSIDPMTAVAKGSALFASTKNIPEGLIVQDKQKVQLQLKYPESTTELDVNVGIRIDKENADLNLPETFLIELIRNDFAWTSGAQPITDVELINLALNENKINQFQIKLTDLQGNYYPCQPESISIMNGLKMAKATLPYSIGIELIDSKQDKQGVYPLKGLEKNRSLPASGQDRFKTSTEIRSGHSEDKIIIPIYEIVSDSAGSSASLNNFFGRFVLSGVDIPYLLPENSDIELRLKIDESRRGSISLYIPEFDDSFDIEIQSEIETDISKDSIDQQIIEIEKRIASNQLDETHLDKLSEIKQNLQEREGDRDTRQYAVNQLQKIENELEKETLQLSNMDLAEELNESFDELNQLNENNDYPIPETELARFEQEKDQIIQRQDVKSAIRFKKQLKEYTEFVEKVDNLNSLFQDLSTKNQENNYELSTFEMNQLKQEKETAIKNRDLKLIKTVEDKMIQKVIQLERNNINFWIGFWAHYTQNFNQISWINPQKARLLLNEIDRELDHNPQMESIRSKVIQVAQLIDATKPSSVELEPQFASLDRTLLRR